MNIVLFENIEITKPLLLTDLRAQHILKVLHKCVGDDFEAGIIGGNAGKATITKIDDNAIYFNFSPLSDGKPLYPLIMLIGFPRPIQLKRLFRDMAGLGVSTIHLMGTELGEKSYMSSNLIERGTAANLLLDGTVQAKSTHVPELILHNSVKECLEYLSKKVMQICTPPKSNLKIAFDNIGAKYRLADFLNEDSTNCKATDKTVFAAIGSERGWSDNERTLLEQAGFTRCSIGTRVLRTETAATVAASIILSNMEVI